MSDLDDSPEEARSLSETEAVSRQPRTVAITGASGLIGSALYQALRDRGDLVVHLVRREPRSEGLPAGVREAEWKPQDRELDPAVLTGVDAIVHLAGAGIGDHRWTQDYKESIRNSRIDGTETVAQAVASLEAPIRLVCGSAIGYYGNRGTDVLTEESRLGEGFLAEVCRDWEAATWRARQARAPVALARTGIVLSVDGGAMAKMMPLAKFGLAGPLGSGKQYWAWITLHDQVRALMFLVDHPDVTGAVNLCGPSPDTQADVVKALGEQLRRPAVLPAPTIALRVALGEMAGDILGSQRALPTVLTEAGFSWDHPDLDSAMDWLTASDRRSGDGSAAE
ncbi:MAG: TIGR01777 family oxidoreductase [Ornithinimicrobium sp.]